MRTRFHSPAFFNSLNAVSFLLLPLPPPPVVTSPPTFSLTEAFSSDALLTDFAIPQLPIQSALSRFYSDIVPEFVDHPPTSPITAEVSMVNGDMEMNNPHEFEKECKVEQFQVLQFEVPQPDTLAVNANVFKEIMHVLPGASEVDALSDEMKFELSISNLSQKSVYSVDSIRFDYHQHEESSSSENDNCLPNHFHLCAFPHFEVDDMIFESFFEPATWNELLMPFHCTELEYKNQDDHIVSAVKELLPSTDISLVDTIQIKLENFDTDGTDLVLEKDFNCMKENYSWKEQSASFLELNSCYYISFDPVFFQEFLFYEINPAPQTDTFLEYTKADNPLNLGSLLKENLGFLTFDELIVSYELVLADDMFRSLPVPIIPECEATTLLHDSIWKVLAELKPQPLSVSSDIYLDWHLLEDHKLNHDTSSVSEKLLEDLNHRHIEQELIHYDKDMSILSLMSEDTDTLSFNKECKVYLNLVSGSCFGTIPQVDVTKGVPRILISGNGGVTQSNCADVETILTKAVPQFNDLEFFLNPQEDSFETKRIPRCEKPGPTVTGHANKSIDCILLDTIPVRRFHHWDVRIHPVPLSDSILTLVDYFQKCYLAILESITLLQTAPSFPLGDKSKLLRFTKQELVNEIGGLIALSSNSGDENIMALLTLIAIKQMAWYVCFYGIHATQSYVCNLFSAVGFLRIRLCFLQSLISDAVCHTDEDITRSHPLLAKISDILTSRPFDGESKILIVIEQVLWCPLKLLLTAIGLSVQEIQNFQWPSHLEDPCGTSASSTAVTDIPLNADCLIVSHKSISGIFPFHKFTLILEYGGSHVSPRLTSLPKTSTGLPPLNFLKMELEPLDTLKVFCENSELPFSFGAALEGQDTSLLQTRGNINLQKLEQVLNSLPDSDETSLLPSKAKIADACTASSSISLGAKETPSCTIPIQSDHRPFKNIVTQNHPGFSSCPEQLIVMNTQNLNKEMIVSRRSTYQKVISLEKERVQVVERDSSLPVDIILTASKCLIWYESGNLSHLVNQTETSSCFSSYIEHIATSVLMQLSFAFTSCYMVFEGNHSFTYSISEYAEGLYAAAASLGIDIQLLYSHSSELTGEIILNCIRSATRFSKNLYPPMSESETFAECFLTKFPSINPLSAHAILCSANSFYEFFQFPLEVRLQVLEKFCVPQVSISLLSVLCKFAEREDCRSGTTDCSSVSSAPETEYIHCKLGLRGSKRKSSGSPSKYGIMVDNRNRFQYEPSNASTDAGLNPPKLAAQKLVDPNESTNFGKQKSGLDYRLFGSQGEGRFMSGDEICADTFKLPYSAKKFVGEADFNPDAYLGDDCFPFDKSGSHSPLYGKRKVPEPINPGLARRLSFDAISDPIFPGASKINFDLCMEKNNGNHEYESAETNDLYNFTDFRSEGKLSKVGHDDPERRHEPNAKRYPSIYQETDVISRYGGTPLRNAIDSLQLQPGSPWTIEFLNRVKEKSRAHQKSLSSGTFSSDFGIRGKKHHSAKRKSPSIIDFYRYQGGCSSAQKTIGRNTRLQEKEPLCSLEREDASASRTPHDKRARKALSFTVSKHGSQSKLVWLDGSI